MKSNLTQIEARKVTALAMKPEAKKLNMSRIEFVDHIFDKHLKGKKGSE